VPWELFTTLAEVFREALADGDWKLPSMKEVLAMHSGSLDDTPSASIATGAAAAASAQEPSPVKAEDPAPLPAKIPKVACEVHGDLKKVADEGDRANIKRRRMRSKTRPLVGA